MSFLIVEYLKSKPEIDARFWRGGKIDQGFHSGIYRASNFKSKQTAIIRLESMKSDKKEAGLKPEMNYKVLEFHEAKKLTSNPVY